MIKYQWFVASCSQLVKTIAMKKGLSPKDSPFFCRGAT